MQIINAIGNSDCSVELPEGKSFHPTHPDQPPFRSLQRYLDIERQSDGLEAVREVKNLAVKKLEMLDQMHKDLLQQAHSIIEKARSDIKLHAVRMHAAKVRNRIYHLYSRSDGQKDPFFSILEPDDYREAEPNAEYLGAFRLNEDSSWTRID